MTGKTVTQLLQKDERNWFDRYVVGNAPRIMGVLSNFVVIVADVRVYDVVYRLTDNNVWKALSASFACAIPFIAWEIAWQYNHTTEGWRKGSLFMAGIAFAASIFLGVADFMNFTGAWTDWLLGGIVVLTGLHTVVGFLYYYNDPDVARARRKAQTLADMEDNEQNALVAETLLSQGTRVLDAIQELERKYSPEEVETMLSILSGKGIKPKN